MRGSDSHRGNSLRGCHLILRSPRFLYRNSSSNSCGAMGSRRGGGSRGTHGGRDMRRHLFWLGNLRMIRKRVKSRRLCRSGCRGLYLRRLRGSTCRRSRRRRAQSGLLCSAGYRSRSRRRRSDWPHGTRGRGRVCRYRSGRRCTGRAARVTGLGAICAATCVAEGCSALGDVAKRAPTGRGVHAGSKASAAAFGSGVAEEATGTDAKCEPAFTMRTRDCPAT